MLHVELWSLVQPSGTIRNTIWHNLTMRWYGETATAQARLQGACSWLRWKTCIFRCMWIIGEC